MEAIKENKFDVEKTISFFQNEILLKLPTDIRDKVAIAGGSIRDKLLNVKIKDYDVFVQDKDTEQKLMEFFNNNGKEGRVNDYLANYTYEKKWIQIVRGKYYNMKTTELIDSFDYTICMAMITTDGIKVGEHFFEDLKNKRLRINKITYPLATLERLQKYIKKGFTACNGTLLEIVKAIQKVNLEDSNSNSLVFYPDGTPRFLGMD